MGSLYSKPALLQERLTSLRRRPPQASSMDGEQKLSVLKEAKNHPPLMTTFLQEGALVLGSILGSLLVHYTRKTKYYHSKLFNFIKKTQNPKQTTKNTNSGSSLSQLSSVQKSLRYF